MTHKYNVGDKVYFRPGFTLEDAKLFLSKHLPLSVNSANEMMLEEISDLLRQKQGFVVTGRSAITLHEKINIYYISLPESLRVKSIFELRWIYFEEWLVSTDNEVHIEEEE